LSKVRDFLIGYGAQVIAPCFHQYACKLSKTNDWCHFQERIARTKEMRFLKNAERGYEDEAYAYLLVSKENKVDLSNANSRIIANPMQHGGHLALKLCKSDGKIENVTLSKKNDIYQKAKKLKWGDDYVL
jgi:ribosomal protein RSM22 (predicted rRNA methylase)